MSAWDNLGPQFGAGETSGFDPSGKVWGGSAFQYARVDPKTGQSKRNSRNVANMKGRFFSADVSDQLPAGHSTDFTTRGMNMDLRNRFAPNSHGNQSGAWN